MSGPASARGAGTVVPNAAGRGPFESGREISIFTVFMPSIHEL